MAFVNSVLERFNEVVDGGDPVFRQLFLLRSFKPVLLIASCYVLFVKVLGPAIMKTRKPIRFPYVMSVYNFLLVGFYIYFILHGLYFFQQLGLSFFCGALSHNQGPIIVEFFKLGWRLYIVKYIELIDTIFLVISKKFNMITNLHVFHHAIVPVFGFIAFRSETSAYLTVFMGINSIIHIFMYTYYGIAVLGPEYQKYLWWKKYLTSLQIMQFFFMTVYLIFMYAVGCITSKSTLAFSIFLSIVFGFLFVKYYRKTFTHQGKMDSPTKSCIRLTSTGQETRSQKLNSDIIEVADKTMQVQEDKEKCQ